MTADAELRRATANSRSDRSVRDSAPVGDKHTQDLLHQATHEMIEALESLRRIDQQLIDLATQRLRRRWTAHELAEYLECCERERRIHLKFRTAQRWHADIRSRLRADPADIGR
jgi:hypothetical protein